MDRQYHFPQFLPILIDKCRPLQEYIRNRRFNELLKAGKLSASHCQPQNAIRHVLNHIVARNPYESRSWKNGIAPVFLCDLCALCDCTGISMSLTAFNRKEHRERRGLDSSE
jgi:hypothetical protein